MNFRRYAAATAAMLAVATTTVRAEEVVSVTLDWTPNTNFVGMYVAESLGLYADAGLDVQIAPFAFGQPHGDVAAFGVLDFYTAKAKGLDHVGVFAVVQTETGRVAYAGDVTRPRDLSGRNYGGFGTTWEKAILDTIIATDGGEPTYNSVTLNSSVYEALRAGEIDFTLEVATWQGVENELAGHEIKSFRYADYGVPDQHTIMLAASAQFLEERPQSAKAFLEATLKGYEYAVENPEKAAQILIDAAPELAEQKELVNASMQLMVRGHYIAREDGTVGLFKDAAMLELGDFLYDAGALVGSDGAPLSEKPDFSTWYSNQFLK